MAYTGQTYRGVDYSPTWPGWVVGAGSTQTGDSDFANDAFASLWGKGYQAAPAGSPSVPFNNGGNYRNDLQTIANDGFNLVRLYNWDMARGTTGSSDTGLDHINFLNYAQSLGLKVIVPVSDFFLNDTEFSWNGKTPDSSYSFGSANDAIKKDFTQFVKSIIDPATGKIHAAVHSIAVGNEGDIGEGLQDSHTSASNFLARTNWWIVNLHKQINGDGTGPDGSPVVNGSSGALVPLSATFANADQGTGISSWFKALVSGVKAGDPTPNPWIPNPPGGTTFSANVTGLATADPLFEKYYYNSFNIGQSTTVSPFGNGIAATLALYDSGASPWPGEKFNVPLLLMEVFTPNRSQFPTPADQAVASVNEAKAIEAYLAAHQAGTAGSTTNLMGYNYFEFNDEPAANKMVGLYQYTSASTNAQTGTTGVFYGTFPNAIFPVYTLTPTPGPDGKTLAHAWTATFAATHPGSADHDTLVGSAAADRLHGLAGNDSIDGGAGHDTAHYGQNANNYTLKATAASAAIAVQDIAAIAVQDSAAITASAAITVHDKVGTDGTDTLTNIENIRFTDQALPTAWLIATAALPTAQILSVVDLYTAGLNRAPDALGLYYYASKLADGASISDISKAIFGSAEAASIYSPNNSNTTFVNLVYQTALGRAPDAAGAAYWLNELNTGHIQRTDLVTSLIFGAGGAGGTGGTGGSADAQYIANKEAVGAHFALTQGLNNVTAARMVEAAVNGTASSVTTANAQTDAFAAIAATAAGTELVVQLVGVAP
jgi:hypothetical protein